MQTVYVHDCLDLPAIWRKNHFDCKDFLQKIDNYEYLDIRAIFRRKPTIDVLSSDVSTPFEALSLDDLTTNTSSPVDSEVSGLEKKSESCRDSVDDLQRLIDVFQWHKDREGEALVLNSVTDLSDLGFSDLTCQHLGDIALNTGKSEKTVLAVFLHLVLQQKNLISLMMPDLKAFLRSEENFADVWSELRLSALNI